MRKVMVEFPIVGYAEVIIEVPDDMDDNDIVDAIRDGDIDVVYNGRDFAESLTPLMDMSEVSSLDIPQSLQVVE